MICVCRLLCLTVSLLCLGTVRTLSPQEGTCTIDVSKEERVKRIRANIVNQMGLSEEPDNPKVPIVVPEEKLAELRAVQNAMGTLSKDDSCIVPADFAREKRVFSPTKASTVKSDSYRFDTNYLQGDGYNYGKRHISSSTNYFELLPPHTYKFSFDVDLRDQKMISSAELLVFKKAVYPQSRYVMTELETIQVQLVYKTYYYYYKYLVSNEAKEIMDTKIVSTNTDEYISFNVTGAIKKWLQVTELSKGEIRFEIVVRCPEIITSSYKQLPPLIEFDIGSKQSSNSSAKLVISFVKPEELIDIFSSSRSRRTKKQVGSFLLDDEFCFDNPSEPNCCVRQLTINFADDFGWTWVMAPLEYNPNYCSGVCPFFWPTFSESTQLLQQYNSINPSGAVEPCCAPDKIEPLVMLFSVNGELFLQMVNNMEVDTCICR